MIGSRIDRSVWAVRNQEWPSQICRLDSPPPRFLFLGYLKNEVYSEEPITVKNMKEIIGQAQI